MKHPFHRLLLLPVLLAGCYHNARLAEMAADGDADAQYEYGRRLLTGQKGMPESPDRAIPWLRKSAAQGDDSAMAALGLCYERGLGVDVSYRAARRWYEKAIAAGNEDACLALLQMEVRSGHTDQAVRRLKKCADDGGLPAQLVLGRLYFNGRLRDYISAQDAARYIRYAAMQGSAEACLMLSACYAEGVGVPKDDSIMLGWLINAAELGHKDAIDLLEEVRLEQKKQENSKKALTPPSSSAILPPHPTGAAE